MGVWRARQQCFVLGVQLVAGQMIGLSDENERELKLGKYAEKVPDEAAKRRDPNSKKMKSIGYQHLEPVSRDRIDESQAVDGMVLYPPPKPEPLIGQSRGDAHPTQFETARV